MKKYLLLFLSLFLHGALIAQANFAKLEVYQSFEEKAYTAAGLYAKHLNLEKESVSTFKISDQQLAVINKILSRAGVTDYFVDRKDVTSAITFVIAEKKGEKVKLVINSNKIIIDLTHRKKYFIRKDEDREFIKTLILEVKKAGAASQTTLIKEKEQVK